MKTWYRFQWVSTWFMWTKQFRKHNTCLTLIKDICKWKTDIITWHTFRMKTSIQVCAELKLSHSMTKPTKRPLRPSKTQISWAFAQSDQSSLSAWRNIGSLATHGVPSEDWSDWAEAQADLRHPLAHIILLVLSCGGSTDLQTDNKPVHSWGLIQAVTNHSKGSIRSPKSNLCLEPSWI